MSTPILIVTVTQLNKQVKGYLENEIGTIHVEGEVSNLSKPASGHFYFTLKDESAQLRCVFFKNRHFLSDISTKLTDGQKVIASGKLSLYEARGDYQLIVEELTDTGLGALYQLFEELKNKLAAEGLFDASRKKKLPFMPCAIGIISSASGAALQDILSTLARRFPQAKVFIYPSEVQGINAPQQLIKALQHANSDNRCDVLILARGGGSIEDLWAFNDEHLAREIAFSTIPIISGVGHETDFTIADFVADYRAETPTAAAIAATPNYADLLNIIDQSILRLLTAMTRIQQTYKIKLHHLMDKIASPEKTIATYWQRMDYLERQLIASLMNLIYQKKHQLDLYSSHLKAQHPKIKISQQENHLNQLKTRLIQNIQIQLTHCKYQLSAHVSTLQAISPLATLERGYAIASKKNKVLYDVSKLKIGDSIDIRLSKGGLICEVTEISPQEDSVLC